MKTENEYTIEKDDAQRLLFMLQEAHYQAAMNNDNISKSVFMNAYAGSGNAVHSVAAALLSTGGKHAPITECRELLQIMLKNHEYFTSYASNMVKSGEKIPGIGNSFFKDCVDPSFQPVNDFYRHLHMQNDLGKTYVDTYAEVANKIINEYRPTELFTDDTRIPLQANAALITAGIVEFLGGKPNIENWFLVAGRSRAFFELSSKIDSEEKDNNKE